MPVEDDSQDSLLDVLGEKRIGCIAFSPPSQGQLTNHYLAA
jgi:aryl-alcohol dehydrogenase-like predicted oxidoreductase